MATKRPHARVPAKIFAKTQVHARTHANLCSIAMSRAPVVRKKILATPAHLILTRAKGVNTAVRSEDLTTGQMSCNSPSFESSISQSN
ncbi:hypothetical protein FKM82_019495 [Ascaphus truei]